MENSDSTITSLPRVCEHKSCKSRFKCRVAYKRELRRRRRNETGLPWWMCEEQSIEGHLKTQQYNRDIALSVKGRINSALRSKKYRAKNKELYGGYIHYDTVARGRWILAREGGVTE